jgi:hypothetical protein
MKAKKINLSESANNNSSQEVACPSCFGGNKNCADCHGCGVMSKAKATRLKQSKSNEKI